MDAYLESAGERRHLTGNRAVIGRSPRSDVVLDADGQVSRTHAVLDRIAGRWILRDVGSRNGTRVNGEAVLGPVRLRAGDDLQHLYRKFGVDGRGAARQARLAAAALQCGAVTVAEAQRAA